MSVQAALYFVDVVILLAMLLLLLTCLRNILLSFPTNNGDLENQLPPGDLPQQNQLVPITNATIVRYKKGGKIESRWTADCVICLEEFKDGDSCSVLPSCKHLYHRFCIDQWLARNRHCPLCRGSVRPSREAASTE
ncbi:hypothetical protein V6N13_123327 [Hibiscus sabdariffa]|uniref:RING-type domain-containing protein n=2 Tax=Hibiscus sabdariffa TaxID=183260 RepID=A0ABR1ZQ68_9ROSI